MSPVRRTTVYTNGRFITMEPRRPVVRAVAVRGGAIVAIGDQAELLAAAGSRSRRFDLGGATVTPGIVDSHSNLATTGIEQRFMLDVRSGSAPTIAAILERVRERVATPGAPEWIQGSGWSEQALHERRAPTRAELDEAAPTRPVVLTHLTGHSIVVNSAAMRAAGVDEAIPVAAGGVIARDASGSPTGVFQEFPAMKLITERVPAWTAAELSDAVRTGVAAYASQGVTATKENYAANEYEPLVRHYTRIAGSEDLPVRLVVQCRASSLEDVAWAVSREQALFVSEHPARLRLGSIKIFLDGSLAARTAWTHDEYWDAETARRASGNRGYPALPESTFREVVVAAHRAGFQISVHAIGDRAVDAAVDAYADALARESRPNHGHSIIHALLARPEAMERIRQLGIAVETQPPFIHFLGDAYARSIESGRLRRLIPLRSWLAAGVIVGGGSDGPICPHNLRYGLIAATRRTSARGLGEEVFGSEEAISRDDALALYTSGSARCLGMDRNIGSLEVGKRADLVAWSIDPLTSPADELADLRAQLTVVDGEVSYRARDWAGD